MIYEVQIGRAYDYQKQVDIPKVVFEINEDQFKILEQFADIRRNEEIDPVYVINECRFKMVPKL